MYVAQLVLGVSLLLHVVALLRVLPWKKTDSPSSNRLEVPVAPLQGWAFIFPTYAGILSGWICHRFVYATAITVWVYLYDVYIYWFAFVELSPCHYNEAKLIVINDLFDMFFNLVCKCFMINFHLYSAGKLICSFLPLVSAYWWLRKKRSFFFKDQIQLCSESLWSFAFFYHGKILFITSILLLIVDV